VAAQVALVRQAAAEALGLDNRGPLLLTAEGHLHPTIVESFERHGFYVLTGVIQHAELSDLRADVERLLADTAAPLVGPSRWNMAPPLSDPTGGRGRSPGTRMRTSLLWPVCVASLSRSLSLSLSLSVSLSLCVRVVRACARPCARASLSVYCPGAGSPQHTTPRQ
jgi:hypothetical protein